MNQTRQITPGITVADQPSEADLSALKQQGFAGVANFRTDGEPEQPMSTAQEGERVRALGMDYFHYGVGGDPLTTEGVQGFCAFLDRHADEKVLVHCRKGSRAAALVLLHRALKDGWSPDEAAAKGRAMGLEVEGKLKEKVDAYLREHGPGR